MHTLIQQGGAGRGGSETLKFLTSFQKLVLPVYRERALSHRRKGGLTMYSCPLAPPVSVQ